ncbi:MAG TPA: DUF222 domain-containing protein [Acidimicrobiales bacterium]|nr:DUF222 domain-containing protein [Acidimicrobiales bacterium]
MFEDLERAIEELDIPVDGDAIAEVIGLRDRLDAAITAAVAAFDAAELWDADGATSMTAWLRHHGRQAGRDAKRLASTARRLARLPATAGAYASGQLSGGQVAAIVANLTDATVETFAEQQRALLQSLAALEVADVGRAMQVWRQRAEALLSDEEAAEPVRSLHLSETLAGRWVLEGDLDAEGGGVVSTALRLATSPDVDGEPARNPSRRRADALVDLCRWFLDHQQERRGGRHRPHINVVIDAEAADTDGGSLLGGPRLDGDTVRRLLCDSAVHRVVTAGRSTVLDYGWTTRTIPANLWSALVVRDRHCRFPGCDREAGWCEGHHLLPWTEGGPTRLDNLALLCARHHHRLHEPGWHAKLTPDGELNVTAPDGRVLVSALPP